MAQNEQHHQICLHSFKSKSFLELLSSLNSHEIVSTVAQTSHREGGGSVFDLGGSERVVFTFQCGFLQDFHGVQLTGVRSCDLPHQKHLNTHSEK